MTIHDLELALDSIFGQLCLYSLLSFWVRGETADELSAQAVLDLSIVKELSASQQGNKDQVLNNGHSFRRLYTVVCIKEPPTWYNELLEYDTYRRPEFVMFEDVQGMVFCE